MPWRPSTTVSPSTARRTALKSKIKEGHVLSVHGHSGGHRRHLHPAALRHSQFEDIFKELRCQLPAFTRFVIAILPLIREWWYTPSLAALLSPSSSCAGLAKIPEGQGQHGQVHPHHSRGGQHTAQGGHGPFCPHPLHHLLRRYPTGGCLVSAAGASGNYMSIALRPWPFATRWWPACDQRRHAHRGSFPRHGDPDGDDR